ncbi:MAG: DUF2513 domain-containing protein [Phycisphaeraceae bacterium]|nr:DUF2513 domain-containing protein [Phycisphaeraceae bacterium]
MNRDLGLVRKLMLWFERSLNPGGTLPILEGALPPDRFDEETDFPIVYEHVRLMTEAGLIESDAVHHQPENIHVMRITWAGHEFLASVKDPGVWAKVKPQIASVGGAVAIQMVTALGMHYMRQTFGMPPA